MAKSNKESSKNNQIKQELKNSVRRNIDEFKQQMPINKAKGRFDKNSLGKGFKAVGYNIATFFIHNPIYILCAIIYYFYAVSMLQRDYITPLILFAISLFVVFSPVGEYVMRFLNRVRPVETNQEKEYLTPIFEEVYKEAKRYCRKQGRKLPKIKLYIIDDMTVNACAIGKHTVAVTKGAMSTFSEDELKAILSHEIAHILYQNTIARMYAIVGLGLFSILVVVYRAALVLIDIINLAIAKNAIVEILLAIVRFILSVIVFMFTYFMQLILAVNSRKSEYQADKFAYKIGYGAEMVDALYLLEKISLGNAGDIKQRLTASHPRTTLRIANIEGLLDKEE